MEKCYSVLKKNIKQKTDQQSVYFFSIEHWPINIIGNNTVDAMNIF